MSNSEAKEWTVVSGLRPCERIGDPEGEEKSNEGENNIEIEPEREWKGED